MWAKVESAKVTEIINKPNTNENINHKDSHQTDSSTKEQISDAKSQQDKKSNNESA